MQPQGNGQLVTDAIMAVANAIANRFTKTTDANGWIVKDYVSHKVYEKTINTGTYGAFVTVAANASTSLGALTMPVGITNNMTGLKVYLGVEGGFAGRIYASLDNGNTLTRTGAVNLHIGNLTTGSINFIGYIHIMLTSD